MKYSCLMQIICLTIVCPIFMSSYHYWTLPRVSALINSHWKQKSFRYWMPKIFVHFEYCVQVWMWIAKRQAIIIKTNMQAWCLEACVCYQLKSMIGTDNCGGVLCSDKERGEYIRMSHGKPPSYQDRCPGVAALM